ncbi:triose-phosphate isomerase [Sporolactobacillus putidus]|uniref:Triose-phosphate isomerase n=1 Tax=Sporolactobacillus putidus TaxID=492735 RepID=A0A917S437_9BACL|nr:triose-phosphate isomerase [Sporolactobacillus putidus]GGL57091.1 triose-phosphate isomerase [Sporolactobacillus putidus]
MTDVKVKRPFFIVNPKAYIYGEEVLNLALVTDELAKENEIDCLFTAQLVDIPVIVERTSHLIVTAQHMDPLVPGRGMGHVLPEALKAAGVKAVVLNHAEDPYTLSNLDKTIKRAKKVELLTIVCADTVEQCKAVAQLGPDMMICEPTSLIGTGNTSDDDYIRETNQAIRSVNPDILIMQAAGVSTGDDVYRVLMGGADGTGGTSGIINASDRRAKLIEMIGALKRVQEEEIR